MREKRKLRYRGVVNIRLRASKKIARWYVMRLWSTYVL